MTSKQVIVLLNSWKPILEREFKKDYFDKLYQNISFEYENQVVFPEKDRVFNAFNLTDYNNLKVVIIGQDPYYNEGQANGLAFSTHKNTPIPKSLRNIFIELQSDVGIDYPQHGDLSKWAKQGVLLLNNVLTVRKGNPGSHRNLGWEIFTERVLKELNHYPRRLVYLLWGNDAIKKSQFIDTNKHCILKAPHPSPLSAHRGFFGCKHFSQVNKLLNKQGIQEIDWQI
jgi:uracil-DNA glycosylase